MVIGENREHGKNLFLCFIDYTKAFDKVAYDILRKIMNDMGFLEHITLFLKAIYNEQKTAMRTTYDMTEWFEIHHGVRQVGILPPQLFNIYSEVIMRKALQGFEGSILIGRYQITNP